MLGGRPNQVNSLAQRQLIASPVDFKPHYYSAIFGTGLFSPYRIPSSIRDFLAVFVPALVRVHGKIVKGIASQVLELESRHDPAVSDWDTTGSILG
jgi:hypothetical protein